MTLCEVKVFAESGSVFGAEGQTKCDATRHYYEFVSTEGFISWADARAAAAERGGYLATITSEAEQSCLTDLQGGCGWLGGNDVDAEGAWEWNTGEDWAFENWAPGEPNNGDYSSEIDRENFVAMNCKMWTFSRVPCRRVADLKSINRDRGRRPGIPSGHVGGSRRRRRGERQCRGPELGWILCRI